MICILFLDFVRFAIGKHLLRTQNVSEQSQKPFLSRTQNLCLQQMLRALANGETFVSATMYPQQCVLPYRILFYIYK